MKFCLRCGNRISNHYPHKHVIFNCEVCETKLEKWLLRIGGENCYMVGYKGKWFSVDSGILIVMNEEI